MHWAAGNTAAVNNTANASVHASRNCRVDAQFVCAACDDLDRVCGRRPRGMASRCIFVRRLARHLVDLVVFFVEPWVCELHEMERVLAITPRSVDANRTVLSGCSFCDSLALPNSVALPRPFCRRSRRSWRVVGVATQILQILNRGAELQHVDTGQRPLEPPRGFVRSCRSVGRLWNSGAGWLSEKYRMPLLHRHRRLRPSGLVVRANLTPIQVNTLGDEGREPRDVRGRQLLISVCDHRAHAWRVSALVVAQP
mmetsp:Transcript_24712/g.68937  ORF Transcript_24712/g.68937 Transcript_24712/m.68937 type:complete len:254 (-) Transcript_24712:663-1424(-)